MLSDEDDDDRRARGDGANAAVLPAVSIMSDILAIATMLTILDGQANAGIAILLTVSQQSSPWQGGGKKKFFGSFLSATCHHLTLEGARTYTRAGARF